jgi:aryl-alcohol dehydrogenase-like predicted oxidoreductase
VHGHDPACRALGVALTAYGLLGRGLISGHWRADRNLAGARYAPRRWRISTARSRTRVDHDFIDAKIESLYS